MSFTKMQGAGNDFIVIDCLGDQAADYQALAPALCDRHFGIGADGLLLVLPSEVADFRMRVINADGTEPEMCGNGLRCFARYLHVAGLSSAASLAIETGAGVLGAEVLEDGVRLDMGAPRMAERMAEPLKVGDAAFEATAVSMGNPHCVVFVEDLDAFDFEQYGPLVEAHSAFPQRTNAEFAQVLAPDHIRLKVYERGVGPTLACGTGACATLVAAALSGRTGRAAQVDLPGGTLAIAWGEDGRIQMTGPAQVVFKGVVDALNL
ncbi:diaminopimelate epimerase [bacterium]|nr:diaminopimelate epimerase [bacterium]